MLKQPTKDTFPNAAGMHTASVSSVRSEIVSDPGNPAGVGLQAAGLGSGDATLVDPRGLHAPIHLLCVTDCTTNPTLAGCTTTYDCTTNPTSDRLRRHPRRTRRTATRSPPRRR